MRLAFKHLRSVMIAGGLVTAAHGSTAMAAVYTLNVGAPFAASGTFTYDSQLLSSTDVRISVDNIFLFNERVGVKGGAIGRVSTDSDGSQNVQFTGLFFSPYMTSPSFTGGLGVIFKGPSGSLFNGNELAAPEQLARYFVRGVAAYDSSRSIEFGLSVPEPATWGIMMLGLAVVGIGLRRRTCLPSVISASGG